MNRKMKKVVTVSAIVWIAVFVLFTAIAAVNPFPFSACLAPWGSQAIEDVSEDNWAVCLSEVAKRTGESNLCNRFFTNWLRRNSCVNEVAVFQKNPDVCTRSFRSEEKHRREVYISNCLLIFQQVEQRGDLCEKIKDEFWKEACFRAAREVREPWKGVE